METEMLLPGKIQRSNSSQTYGYRTQTEMAADIMEKGIDTDS